MFSSRCILRCTVVTTVVKVNRFFTFQPWAQAFEKAYVIKMSDGIKARPKVSMFKPRGKEKDKKTKNAGAHQRMRQMATIPI